MAEKMTARQLARLRKVYLAHQAYQWASVQEQKAADRRKQAILDLLGEGYSKAEIAAVTGLTRQRIGAIVKS